MPLDGPLTAEDIAAALGLSGDEAALAVTTWTKIANAIYTRIKADMQVASTVTVASVSGVTAGAAASGPGAGTATSSAIT
jgi:hypothetical protein